MSRAAEDVDLTTTYLGLRLRSPLVASAGPLTGRLDGLEALDAAGIGAVVLPSLFEEQVVADQLAQTALFDPVHADAEAAGWLPEPTAQADGLVDRHVRHLEQAKRTLDVPVIASVNGVSHDGWQRYARLLQDAGADAVELNLYRVAADVDVPGDVVEAEQLALVEAVRGVLMVPLAVKVGPHYSAFGHVARRLVEAGADAIVLFNRFYQPDVSPETRAVTPSMELSTSADLRLPLRWIGLLHGRLDADLAATSGIHDGLDAARALLAGADVAMMTSALLRHGPGHAADVTRQLRDWAAAGGYQSVAQLRGSASQQRVTDPAAFERATYVDQLVRHSRRYHATHPVLG